MEIVIEADFLIMEFFGPVHIMNVQVILDPVL